MRYRLYDSNRELIGHVILEDDRSVGEVSKYNGVRFMTQDPISYKRGWADTVPSTASIKHITLVRSWGKDEREGLSLVAGTLQELEDLPRVLVIPSVRYFERLYGRQPEKES